MRMPVTAGARLWTRLCGKDSVGDLERAVGVEETTQRLLMYFVVPVWLSAGLADWYRHRRTHIETTSGAHESAIHLLMMSEAGIPALLGLFLDVNSSVLLAAIAGLALHELTSIWDVAYADGRREVTPTEQHIHSFLETSPLMAVLFLIALNWDQALALVGAGPTMADFRLRPKRRPLSWRYRVGLLAALGLFGALPYTEELWRCLRARPTLAPLPEPTQVSPVSPADPRAWTVR